MAKVELSDSAAKRVVRVVRKIEGTPDDKTGRGQSAQIERVSFWAKLVAEDPDNPGRYSIKREVPVDYALVDATPTFELTDFVAREINNTTGLADKYAQVTFVGYDSTTHKPLYLFSAGGAPFPIGQFAYMTFQVGGSNVDVFDFERLHPLIY